MHLNEIISHFEGAKPLNQNSYQVKCPVHQDDKASLTITEENNKILLYCHAGCNTKDILRAVNLTEKDLFNDPPKELKSEKPKVVKEYIYKDEKGNPVFKVLRFVPKSFVQAKLENGKWIFNMKDVRYVLYNLNNIVKNNKIYFVEGEKDADNLNEIGLIATTSVGGASGFNKRAAEYSEMLKGKEVVIVPDNDTPGYNYAENIKKALESKAKSVKIIKLVDEIPDLKEKMDISDVLEKYGKEKTLKILNKLENTAEKNNTESIKNIESIKDVEVIKTEDNLIKRLENNIDDIISSKTFEELYKYEIQDIDKFFEVYSKIKELCKKNKITGFDKNYKLYKDSKRTEATGQSNIISFTLNDENIIYNGGRYEISPEKFIYERIPKVGKVLVAYQMIVPIKRYINVEDGSEKIKLMFNVVNNKKAEWKTMIVDKSTISSSQAIVKLSDQEIEVTSENAKALIRYLSEIINLNKEVIPTAKSVSRLGWFNGKLVPYDKDYEVDNEKNLSGVNEKFGESGKLEDWIEFFRERRKYNYVSRVAMAAGVSAILLNSIKKSGFAVHIWGVSENGKSVACMVGQSIFGNPSSDNGIGINFNFTSAGLEYRLNTYNNIPLFINEMQHQKDTKDYDKTLFLVSEGQGKSRSTKIGGMAKETSWNTVVITNGEKNILKTNSNTGAFNRCLSYELEKYSFEDLPTVADFVKENYGTPIKEILKHLTEFDLKRIYKESLEKVKNDDTTNKQQALEAILLTADKVIVDTLFKDNFYLTYKDVCKGTISRKEIETGQRAYELLNDWIVSESRHFILTKDSEEKIEAKTNFGIYGIEMPNGNYAIIPNLLKKFLEDNGFDYSEVVNSWKNKNYLILNSSDTRRNTKVVKINGFPTRCVVVKIFNENNRFFENTNDENEEASDITDLLVDDELPF